MGRAGVLSRARVPRRAAIWGEGRPWGRDSKMGDFWVEGAAGVSMLGTRGPPRRLWGPRESEATNGAGEGTWKRVWAL